MTSTADTDLLAEAHTLAGRYVKEQHAGAFSWPSRAEMLAHPERVRVSTDGTGAPVGLTIVRDYPKGSSRKDFTGTPYKFPPGSRVATHVAGLPGAMPPVDDCSHVIAYPEDRGMTAALTRMGFSPWQHILTPAASIQTVYAVNPTGGPAAAVDLVTMARMDVPPPPVTAIRRELSAAAALYHDDNPFYNTGSWSQAALRGWDPTDPKVGIRPAEMSKSWKGEHPDWEQAVCGWTPLAAAMPHTKRWLDSIPWAGTYDRVRLLKLAAGGSLARHSDVIGRWTGTTDGLIARFHLPLVTDPRITMSWWEVDGTHRQEHLAPGVVYYHDARKPHAVHNESPVDRVQLCIDVVVDGPVRDAIAAGSPL